MFDGLMVSNIYAIFQGWESWRGEVEIHDSSGECSDVYVLSMVYTNLNNSLNCGFGCLANTLLLMY